MTLETLRGWCSTALCLSVVILVFATAACSKSHGASAPPDAYGPPDVPRDQSEAQLLPQRQACDFKAGAWANETIGNDYPLGNEIPIDHVIFIMQENRSFDQYLGRLVAQGYYQSGDFTTPDASGFAHSDEVDVPPAAWALPDGSGNMVSPLPDDEYCFTANHSWNDMHQDWDGGKNDGFVEDNNPDGARSIFYEDDTVIPFYYALASTFAIGDRYFASVMSSTWPNRFFAMSATSFGIGDNSFDRLDTAQSPSLQIFSELERAGRTWKDYTDGPHQEDFYPTFGFSHDALAHDGDIKCDLMSDIANGTLPDVSYVMGDEVTESSDEGPSDLPGIGAQLVEQIIRNLWASPSWKDTAVFIAYDENGGTADHVPPAPACEPDAYAPHDGSGNAFTGAFDHTGFRVPFIVVSPYARKHFVSHQVYDHTSVVRFIEARFGLPAMTARDANASVPMDMFDFKNPPFMTPPTITAHTTVDPAILAQCKQELAPLTCN